MDLTKIKLAEHSKDEALMWWRMYLKNVMMLRKIREQNRQLRLLLSDYVN